MKILVRNFYFGNEKLLKAVSFLKAFLSVSSISRSDDTNIERCQWRLKTNYWLFYDGKANSQSLKRFAVLSFDCQMLLCPMAKTTFLDGWDG